VTLHRRKTCKDCGAEKPLREFYRHAHYADGHMNTCKACKRVYVAENVELKFEQYRATKRLRDARPENVAKRVAYRRTPRGRASHRASCRRYMRFQRMAEQEQRL
jgi:hypothetical protein